MGMSGGVDSSYLLYVMVNEYNLRPLVFHMLMPDGIHK